jgi:hypothetical protein
MYLGLEDKGSVFSILKNWPERRVKAICLTDGQRVGHLGDLGVQVRWGGVLPPALPCLTAAYTAAAIAAAAAAATACCGRCCSAMQAAG